MWELRTLLRIIWKRKWVLLAVPALAAGVSWVVTENITPRYKVTSTLVVGCVLEDFPVTDADLRVGQEIVRNYARVASEMTFLRSVAHAVGSNLSEADLSRMVSVYPPPGSSLLQITVVDSDHARACRIADTAAGELVRLKVSSTGVPPVRTFLEQELTRLQSDMDVFRRRLDRLRQRVESRPSREVQLRGPISDLEQKIDRSRSDLFRLIGEIRSAQRLNLLGKASGSSKPVYPSLLLNVVVAALTAAILTLLVVLLLEGRSLGNTRDNSIGE
jgi:capsular polysaccharide biosynthesis protein